MTIIAYTSPKKWCLKPSVNDKIAFHLSFYLSGLKHSCKAQGIVDKGLDAGVYNNASAHEVCFIKGSYTFASAAKIFVDTVVGDIIRARFTSRYARTVHHGCVFEGRLYENMDRFLCLFLDKRKRRRRRPLHVS
ncbi:unnamed protein product [Cylicocyclus nassatus]|uniref:Uncharacterized protein n=1 Tax=Cylicocyclus nassatus TaxID=53992 RepID=A0AA36GPL0_CYLNA|nr:unnamed protein product [Cylicocyclus nassatus]